MCCSEKVREVIKSRLWLWTTLSISLCCFVTSGVSFLWQNTLQHVWGVSKEFAFFSFITSTGVGGLVGVVLGPKLFDGHLGGFGDMSGKAKCLLWCMRLTCLAALCGTVCAVLLSEKAAYSVYNNNEDSTSNWTLVILNVLVFIMFACINAVTGVLYGINTEAAADELRSVAAGLTVSSQNVFGYACGPLIPGAFAAFVGISVSSWWPEFHWDAKALDGAKFSAGMGLAFVTSWFLFLFARRAAQRARVMEHRAR
ncbi:unnamed protein product [Prorocentrum cordatum]|uniref:Uncharacterized protein n=1 Tax=Prorocentrum cordatum TaxID=2364126 RepID=A0ABN9VV02_9DINO|nr:unnamed protein product [Polarella glacialis]